MNDLFHEPLPNLILFLPLLAAVVITLFTQKNGHLSAVISVVAILGAFGAAIFLFCSRLESLSPRDFAAHWLTVDSKTLGESLRITFGFLLDRLSLLMMLIVTGVGSMIHIYSVGYMRGDRSFGRFFACLSFFTFSMLGIVFSDNFLQMFIFWELVGVSSYLLIGFWYERGAAADAAKKAFLTNRIGDFGFLIGIIFVWSMAGTLNFIDLRNHLTSNPVLLGGSATAIGLLIFCGAVGKSAQFPLHVWLPDAMEGPTPVSALIHAATMVAAGVYMLSRVFFLFNETSLTVIAWTGGFTAIMAALIAVQQDDIKRILAYSTLSQLGYMVMAVGLHEPPAGMFHLATHAFFKALLFLGAGSVIHALHHEQNIWKMGRLKDKMSITFWTFLIGTLALSGFPFLSGFYSKDSILAAAYRSNLPLFYLGVVVAFCTTFYMFRLIFVVFLGKSKSEASDHAHESPFIMTGPLLVLAVLALVGGVIGIEEFVIPKYHSIQFVKTWSERTMEPFSVASTYFGIGAFVVGLALSFALYAKAASDPLPRALPSLMSAMRNRFYFDELYAWLIAMTHEALAEVASLVDRWVISGMVVRGAHGATEFMGRALRLLQTGNLQTYSFLFAAGIALALYLMLLR
ncbi:MAG TPA: NADH-quinone oxidoreductase subunit L [Verrucomicrobiae bacterium]|jgi:NADH-quinone oxidoreductase subunit L|nr:NADH-quinone oxidoreductase subunit L [Verrucomicrobiae bacterium]